MTNFQFAIFVMLFIWLVVFPLGFLALIALSLHRDAIQNPKSKIDNPEFS